ncbi:DNA gyrase inhibitor YacG [Pseudonocardia sp. TMWB2A]|uniref:DNA gyrase inhibitor YacG n=1 Tax=Pseudonocardia sp. TMWB2A TaxID=687430 RepID=UPI00307DA373
MAAMSVKPVSQNPTKTATKRARACPICGKATVQDYRPFCSKGCRDRDFLHWADDGYKLPGAALDEDALEQIEKNNINGLDSGTDD